MALDKKQLDEIHKIFAAAESQKKIDIDLFRSSATALIRAAENRREIMDSRIMDMLTDIQKRNFEAYLKERKSSDELFRLRNAVFLSDKQAVKIELIISVFRERLNWFYKKLDYYVQSGQDRKQKTNESAKLLGNRNRGLEGRSLERKKLELGPPGKIRELNAEKAKEIRKHLNEDQNILYKEYLKYEDQQLNMYIKKLKR